MITSDKIYKVKAHGIDMGNKSFRIRHFYDVLIMKEAACVYCTFVLRYVIDFH